jgi:predicted N-formylglutamate amidohydrolase
VPSLPLLGPDDPPPVTVFNAQGQGRGPGLAGVPEQGGVVVVCDHARPAVPRSLNGLGLEDRHFRRHIAYDIGAAEVALALAAMFDAPAVLSGYSRLVIDLNRSLDDPTAVPVLSDDTVIPGNRAIDADGERRRVDAIFRPYHETIAAIIAARRQAGQVPAIVSIHSFTPSMHGIERPWHVGVLWDYDPRLPVPLMQRLRDDGRWRVGDNEPYSGRNTPGGTIETHATPAGLPNVLIELRQDLIATSQGVEAWAGVLAAALRPILADPGLFRVEHHLRPEAPLSWPA